MKDLNIAIIVPSLINRGPVLVVKDIVEQLTGRVGKLVVFYLDDIPAELIFDCQVQRLIIKNATKQLRSFNIIHTHMLRPNLLVAFLPLKSATKIATLHNYIYDDVSNSHNRFVAKIIQFIWVLFLKKYDIVVCLTNHMKKYYECLGLKDSKIDVIYNGRPKIESVTIGDIDAEDNNNLINFKSQYFSLGVSAMLTPRKGIDQLISALPYTPKVGLIILGDGPEKDKLITLAQILGVTNQCLFLGYKQKANRYFKYFDGFAMPSYSEGFPLAFIEATSFGLPILVSDLPIFREITHKDEVIFVRLNDVNSMTDAIHNLIKNRNNLSKMSYMAFTSRFDSVIMGNKYLKLFLDTKTT